MLILLVTLLIPIIILSLCLYKQHKKLVLVEAENRRIKNLEFVGIEELREVETKMRKLGWLSEGRHFVVKLTETNIVIGTCVLLIDGKHRIHWKFETVKDANKQLDSMISLEVKQLENQIKGLLE